MLMKVEKVLLKVSPMKGMVGFSKKGKLNPRFIDPFEVSEKICEMTYRLSLPLSLSSLYSIFYLSMLPKQLG